MHRFDVNQGALVGFAMFLLDWLLYALPVYRKLPDLDTRRYCNVSYRSNCHGYGRED